MCRIIECLAFSYDMIVQSLSLCSSSLYSSIYTSGPWSMHLRQSTLPWPLGLRRPVVLCFPSTDHAIVLLESFVGFLGSTSARSLRCGKSSITRHARRLAPVDLQRIKDCLRQACTISKTRALRNLVKKYCAPGVAPSPLTDIFTDEADYEKKVGEIYRVRSKYVHEGRLKPSTKLKYPFEVLHNAALRSLGHILQIRLEN